MKAYLALEDGTVFEGISVGANGTVIGEIVFNTSMTGYQEALTDPSYYGQIVAMTYPLIGNYGVNEEDIESEKIQVSGFIMREMCKRPSNWRMTGTLGEYLTANNVVAIEGIDTRELTKIIREKGAMNGIITTDGGFEFEKYKDMIKDYKIKNAVKSVTCKEPYTVKTQNAKWRVALLDLGTKYNIIRKLNKFGWDVTVFPAFSDPDLLSGFDGVMLSNGPGDPKECKEIVDNIKKLQSKGVPIFGICLGHQLTALANGLNTIKMKYGHRGSNHPVTHKEKNRTYITSQNHGYMVEADGIDERKAEITHFNLNDNTVEGIRYKGIPVFTVQFHPEASQGPHDTGYLFNDFIRLMEVCKNA